MILFERLHRKAGDGRSLKNVYGKIYYYHITPLYTRLGLKKGWCYYTFPLQGLWVS